MSHSIRYIEGVPLIYRIGLFVPYSKLNDFPDCCGPGEGVGERAVPDTMYLLRVSAGCFGHDDDFIHSEPTWDAYHASNSRMLTNLLSIINRKSKFILFRILRRYRAMSYFNAVDEVSVAFWNVKKRQMAQGMWEEYTLPDNV